MTDPQLLKVCDLYRRTSRGTGERQYLVGYLGAVKVLIFRVNNPEVDGPSHTMFLAERKPRQYATSSEITAPAERAIEGEKTKRD
jgi:hypothetical protein